MTYPASPESGETTRIRPDAGQFWAGVAATAIVAALVALVGILICRWTLGIPVLAPSSDGAWGNAHTGEYVLAAVGVALVAGALLYLMMLGTPQPGMFLGWIIGLATLAAVVYPFSTGAPLEQKAATAIVNLVLGVAIGTLLNAVAARAVRRYRYVRPPADRRYERDQYGRDQYGQDRYERDRYERDRHDHPPTQPIDYPPSRTPGDY
jgi:Family of unknown function (DUF6069)